MADQRPETVTATAQLTGERRCLERVAPVAVGGRDQAVGQPSGKAGVHLVALDEVHVERLVPVLGQQQRTRRCAVASPSAGLLVVGLERGRHRGVHHRAHVRLVHTHPERVGGADDANVIGQEAALDLGAPVPL